VKEGKEGTKKTKPIVVICFERKTVPIRQGKETEMKTRLSVLMVLVMLAALFSASVTHADGPIVAGVVDAGLTHTCAVTTSGAVDCWGDNSFGQADDRPGAYTQVSASFWHTCALASSGAADCWGYNAYGQAEGQLGPYTQISAGTFHNCALTPGGAVDCWGKNDYGQSNDQPGPYTQVSAGADFTCALTASGAADCWGRNFDGEANDKPGPYTQVSAGSGYTCALTPSGAMDCWGYSSCGQADDQPGPYTQVSAGYYHTCALTLSGGAECWGFNVDGRADDQPGPYTQVSVGSLHTCALTPTGAVDCWGDNYNGQAEDRPGPYGPFVPSPPVVTVTGVSDGAVYTLGTVPEAGCSTADAESGVATEASLSLSGGTAQGVGSFTATCSGAADNAGNQADPVSASYKVTFQFTGFTAPVDNPDVLNVAKAGQTVPLKWRLTDASGSPVTGLAGVSVTAVALACEQGENPDPIEEYAQGTSGLQNLGDGYYQWNWKTPKAYAGLCKTLKLDLGEGAGYEHLALFQFR
jgi:hypothetical protein